MEDRGKKWGIGKMFFECVMSCESVLCVMIKEKKEKDRNCFRFFSFFFGDPGTADWNL